LRNGKHFFHLFFHIIIILLNINEIYFQEKTKRGILYTLINKDNLKNSAKKRLQYAQ
jgi:hypothetical protein